MQLKHALTTLALVAPSLAQGVLQRRLSQQEIKDAQESLTILPESICQGCQFDGQAIPVAGQVASRTSKNNFANFCLQFDTPNQNGEQLFNGSCSQIPIGQIMAKNRMPSQTVFNPKNNDVLPEGQDINFQVKLRNVISGHFTFAASTYYGAPSEVDPNTGFVIGHTHISVIAINGLNDNEPKDPQDFVFFKGYDGAADNNGIVSVTAKGGLKAGTYKACGLGSNSNHMPWILPVAQRGFESDCVRFTVQAGGAGGGNNNNNNNGGGNGNNASSTAAPSSSAAPTSTATATSSAGNGQGNNQNGGGRNNQNGGGRNNQNGGGRNGGNRNGGGRNNGGNGRNNGGGRNKRSNLPSRRSFSPSDRSRVARHAAPAA